MSGSTRILLERNLQQWSEGVPERFDDFVYAGWCAISVSCPKRTNCLLSECYLQFHYVRHDDEDMDDDVASEGRR